MENNALNTQETTFLRELSKRGVRFILVGLGAAVAQGADTVTQDLDFWFEDISSPEIGNAAKAAGGFYSARSQPPMVGGDGLDRIDIVTHCDGLDDFATEYQNTIGLAVEEFELRVLELTRVIASKVAANRPKDKAVLEQLHAAQAAIVATTK